MLNSLWKRIFGYHKIWRISWLIECTSFQTEPSPCSSLISCPYFLRLTAQPTSNYTAPTANFGIRFSDQHKHCNTFFFGIHHLIFVLAGMWNELVGGMDRTESEMGEGTGINWIWRFTAQVEACVWWMNGTKPPPLTLILLQSCVKNINVLPIITH
jgi:hypothetical protein